MNVLLVEPNFPLAAKSKNHSNFLPIGLLKIAAFHRKEKDQISLHRGNYPAAFCPDEIKITSLFTYWSRCVWDSVAFYKELYPKAKIEVGGIYASLMPEHAKKSGCDTVYAGLYKDGAAEQIDPAYDLVDVDYQIVHASRGCFRKCNFCGTWKIENNLIYKKSILSEVKKNRIIFYDNNLIANPNIKNILIELQKHTLPNGSKITCESQSGLDGRILAKNPELARLLKNARFKNPRIAWDGPYKLWPKIKEQLEILTSAGYRLEDMYVFMVFNHFLSYLDMKNKLDACRRWGIRVIDCRFRPLDLLSDGYNSRLMKQNNNEYYIHPNWTDKQVRAFRKAVRRQNIAILLGLPGNRYIEGVERKFIKV